MKNGKLKLNIDSKIEFSLKNSFSLDHLVGCACPRCNVEKEIDDNDNFSLGESAPPATNSELGVLANYLTNGYWSDNGVSSRRFNLSNSGTYSNNGVIQFNTSGSVFDNNGIGSSSRKTLIREAFKIFEATLGIDFQETSSQSADIDFIDK